MNQLRQDRQLLTSASSDVYSDSPFPENVVDASQSEPSHGKGPMIDTTTFLIVQFVVVLLLVVTVFYCFCKYSHTFVGYWAEARSTGHLSDVQYTTEITMRREREEEKKLDSPEVRRAKLIESFQKNDVTMKIEEKHISSSEIADSELIDDIEMDQTSILILPISEKSTRYSPNCCAICLCSYEIGETIVWSSNNSCHHVFHYECILQWLVKMRKGTPCPCCRQEFTDIPPVTEES